MIWERQPPAAGRTERVRRQYRRNVRWYDLAVERADGAAARRGGRAARPRRGRARPRPRLRHRTQPPAPARRGRRIWRRVRSRSQPRHARGGASPLQRRPAGRTSTDRSRRRALRATGAAGRTALLLHQRHPALADRAASRVRLPAPRRARRGRGREAGARLARCAREPADACLLRPRHHARTRATSPTRGCASASPASTSRSVGSARSTSPGGFTSRRLRVEARGQCPAPQVARGSSDPSGGSTSRWAAGLAAGTRRAASALSRKESSTYA